MAVTITHLDSDEDSYAQLVRLQGSGRILLPNSFSDPALLFVMPNSNKGGGTAAVIQTPYKASVRDVTNANHWTTIEGLEDIEVGKQYAIIAKGWPLGLNLSSATADMYIGIR